MAVPRVHLPVFFREYSHRAHIDADTAVPAEVRINIHFKLDGCRQADFHGRAHGPGRHPAAEREAVRWTPVRGPVEMCSVADRGSLVRLLSRGYIKISD